MTGSVSRHLGRHLASLLRSYLARGAYETENTVMQRRAFLKGCAGFATVAAMRGFGITGLLFDARHAHAQDGEPAAPSQPPPNSRDLLVLVFVRGGLDGLNLVVPFNTSAADRSSYYDKLRPTMNIPAPNTGAARSAVDMDGRFGLHPDAARGTPGVNTPYPHATDTGGLLSLFRNGDLAIVDACGSPDITGSHFDTELYVDLGGKTNAGGWLARYLDAIGEPNDALAISPQWGVPPSLLSTSGRSAIAIPDPEAFGPQWKTAQWTPPNVQDAIVGAQRTLLQQMYQRGSPPDFVEAVGRSAFQGYDMLRNVLDAAYAPAAPYLTDGNYVLDYGHFGTSMRTIAQIAKASVTNPLRVASVDVGGGYDTHDNQGTTDWNGNARFPKLIANLSNNLKAFYDDMNADPQWRGRFTVVVLSEFGRVMYENDSGGCDHGSGNVMLILGSGRPHGVPNINGGQIFGDWPGLQTLGFNDGLPITTDYRRAIADVLTGRMYVSPQQINATVFPGLNYTGGLGIAVPK
jgi:uncharacterized protein (DUF1501 family)